MRYHEELLSLPPDEELPESELDQLDELFEPELDQLDELLEPEPLKRALNLAPGWKVIFPCLLSNADTINFYNQ